MLRRAILLYIAARCDVTNLTNGTRRGQKDNRDLAAGACVVPKRKKKNNHYFSDINDVPRRYLIYFRRWEERERERERGEVRKRRKKDVSEKEY